MKLIALQFFSVTLFGDSPNFLILYKYDGFNPRFAYENFRLRCIAGGKILLNNRAQDALNVHNWQRSSRKVIRGGTLSSFPILRLI